MTHKALIKGENDQATPHKGSNYMRTKRLLLVLCKYFVIPPIFYDRHFVNFREKFMVNSLPPSLPLSLPPSLSLPPLPWPS